MKKRKFRINENIEKKKNRLRQRKVNFETKKNEQDDGRMEQERRMVKIEILKYKNSEDLEKKLKECNN